MNKLKNDLYYNSGKISIITPAYCLEAPSGDALGHIPFDNRMPRGVIVMVAVMSQQDPGLFGKRSTSGRDRLQYRILV